MQPSVNMPSGPTTNSFPIPTTNTNIAISTLLVSIIMKKFEFDTIYYGMIYTVVVQFISFVTANPSNLYERIYDNSGYVLFFGVLLVLGYWFGPFITEISEQYFKQYLKRYFQQSIQQYTKICIYEDNCLDNFTKYIEYNSQYYDNTGNINVGSLDKKTDISMRRYMGKSLTDSLITESKYISQDIDTRINFDDEYLGVKGYYVWRTKTEDCKDIDNKVLSHVTILYVEYNILKNPDLEILPCDIINKINKFADNIGKNKITLKYVKVMASAKNGDYNHIVVFHSGVKEPFEALEERFMKPFFHQDKDRLWSIIKNVCLNPNFYKDKGQVSRVSLLLYGPPGTGKSSFAYRIAMCFLRHIVSLDIRCLGKSKLYQILQRPSIEGMTTSTTYKDVVYLFEEFDISIKELYLREKKTSFSTDTHYSKMLSVCNKLEDKIYDKTEKKDDKKDDKKEDKEENNKKEEDKKEKKKEKKKTNKNEDEEVFSNYNNIYKYFDDNKYNHSPDEFKLRDLLEIFQGPLPFESMIMIANTNKYDEIKEMCPELFRPGRITPVYFGYIDKETLQDISKYFFEKKLIGYIPDMLTIPTSQIIDLAFESLTLEKDKDSAHNYFNKKIEILMSQ